MAVYNITNEYLDDLSTGKTVDSLSGYVLVNEHKSKKTGNEFDEGLFCIAVTSEDALALQYNLDANYIFSTVGVGELINSEFTKPLSGTYKDNSVSRDFVSLYPNIENVELSGTQYIAPDYAEVVTLVVAETKRNSNESGKLDINILEAHTGSIQTSALINGGLNHGEDYYIGNIINRDSKYIKLYKNGTETLTFDYFTTTLIPTGIELLAFNESDAEKSINVNNLFSNINTALTKVVNKNDFTIDIVADSGISSIASTVDSNNNYDNTITTINDKNIPNWLAVLNLYREFCEERKDCIALMDTPRFIEVQGDVPTIRKTNPTNTVTNKIIPKLKRFSGGRVSSFISTYFSWMKVLDTFNNVNRWIPPTSKAIGPYIENDRKNGFNIPPANFSVGSLDNVIDLACDLNKKEADLIYSNGFNYIIQSIHGTFIEGDKTFTGKQTAFSSTRNRRLMNKLNKYVNDICLRYIMEGNTEINRSRIKSSIESIFKIMKQRDTIYDFIIKCDDENNPQEVIDNNELKISIGIKFTSTIDFILADFIATRTDTDFKTILKLY